MTRKLNDTFVTDAVFSEVTAISRGGGRVFLVIGDDRALKPNHCRNCNGHGAVGYQYFTGGPYEATPTIQNMLPNPNRPNDVPARATFFEGKWYKQKTKTHHCPVCEGTGITGGKAKTPPKELSF